MAGKDIFDRLASGRPPHQSKIGDSELARDLQKLHAWLQHRDKPTIALRDICHHGPNCIRERKKAIGLAEILTGNGWLVPERAHRHDRYVWRVVRAHGKHPTLATHPTPPQSG